jgi:TOTE conflict system, Archaeo-Eukaryotic Primase domain
VRQASCALEVTSNGSSPLSTTDLTAKIVRELPVTIDKILTKEEFLIFAEHMGNGNPLSHFLIVWRDDDGNARYAKAKPQKRADVQASWTWDTIIGQAKRKTSMGLYPKNQANQSTWAALDFDAHSGDDKLARHRAFKAFSSLQQYQDRFLLLTASGRGYHVFIFALEARPIAEWVNVLKETCETIGIPILDGVCELFPNERTAGQQLGRAIRLPGSFNPSTEGVELILAETMRPLINQLMSQTTKNSPNLRLYQLKPPHLGKLTEIREANNSSSCTKPFRSASTESLIQGVIIKHPISIKGTRNGVLVKLAGELFHKFGRELSERIVRQHYGLYQKNVNTGIKEHMREFATAWKGFLAKAINSLSKSERHIFDELNTEAQHEAFLLIRSFSNLVNSDFPVGLFSLADRLSISPAGVACVLSKLVELGAIEKTADARINSKPARYRWIANIQQPF